MRGQFGFVSSFILAVAATMAILQSLPAKAQQRVALVVGNGAYQKVPALPNPPNDAADMAASLDRLGFSVKLLTNATFDEFRRALLEFGRRTRGAEMAVLFYAGHGMEIGGENWLVPTDAELRTDTDAENEAVSLRTVMLQVAGASELGLVILDACRNNPFIARMQRTIRTRAVDRGLVRTEPTDNVLVAYAAKDGTTANDGAGRNSPFTAALLKTIETPGLEITFMFRNVRDDVMAATKREQQPFVYGSLSRHAIYLKDAPMAAATPSVATATPAPPPAPMNEAAHAWSNVKDSTNPAVLDAFVKRFADSFYADLARARTEELRRPAATPAAPVTEARLGDPAARNDIVTECDRLAAYPADPQRPRSVPGVPFTQINVVSALTACNEALRQYPDVARIAFQSARVYDAGKDYPRARELYEKAVGLGHVVAMTGLGHLYTNGTGVAKDFAEGRRWFEKAAAAGEPNAMTSIGAAYLLGEGVSKNYGEGRQWLEKAAALGEPYALGTMGTVYHMGLGVPKDPYEARRWFEKGTAAGDSNAMTSLGSYYQNGTAGPRDYSEALRLYQKAAAMGNGQAYYNLGTLYQNGTGVRKNLAEARRWYEKADAAGVEQAKRTLRNLR